MEKNAATLIVDFMCLQTDVNRKIFDMMLKSDILAPEDKKWIKKTTKQLIEVGKRLKSLKESMEPKKGGTPIGYL